MRQPGNTYPLHTRSRRWQTERRCWHCLCTQNRRRCKRQQRVVVHESSNLQQAIEIKLLCLTHQGPVTLEAPLTLQKEPLGQGKQAEKAELPVVGGARLPAGLQEKGEP